MVFNKNIFFCLAIVFGNILLIKSENPFKEIQKFCLQESGATLEMVRAYRPGHSNLSEELMCFIKCTFVKHEIIKADGEIVLDEIKRSHILEDYPEPSKNAVYQCVEKLPKIEKCSDVLALEKCFVENTS